MTMLGKTFSTEVPFCSLMRGDLRRSFSTRGQSLLALGCMRIGSHSLRAKLVCTSLALPLPSFNSVEGLGTYSEVEPSQNVTQQSVFLPSFEPSCEITWAMCGRPETVCISLIIISMERLVDFLDNANGK